jgi:hypothetical protein
MLEFTSRAKGPSAASSVHSPPRDHLPSTSSGFAVSFDVQVSASVDFVWLRDFSNPLKCNFLGSRDACRRGSPLSEQFYSASACRAVSYLIGGCAIDQMTLSEGHRSHDG